MAFRFDYGNRLREVDGKEAISTTRMDAAPWPVRPMATFVPSMGRMACCAISTISARRRALTISSSTAALLQACRGYRACSTGRNGSGYSADGAFAVQWQHVAGAQRYEVQESGGGGLAGCLSRACAERFAGRAKLRVYRYRGRACNGTVCGAWGVKPPSRWSLLPPLRR